MVVRMRDQEKAVLPGLMPVHAPTRDAVARRAYGIYVANGRRSGRAREDWLRAERELQREISEISTGE